MLAFVAPDFDKLGALQQEVKRYIAWTSIMSDKDDLNLDGAQVRETQNNLNRSNDTVEARLKEAYCWLFVPFIDQYGDMKTIQWEISDLGGGTDTIVTKAAKKMLQGEQVITKWAPVLLQMSLDDLLWRETNHIQVKKLWEYLSTYCYLPRLASYAVLEETICTGLASEEYFGIAAAYSEEKERYVDLKINQSVFGINQSDLLVKPQFARDQKRKEEREREEASGGNGSNGTVENCGNGSTGSGSGNSAVFGTENQGGIATAGGQNQIAQNRHFYMSAKLDNTRVNRDINNLVSEIVQHLMAIDDATVELKFEVDVETQNGIPSSVVRTVSENCKTLKVTDFGFDD